MLPYLDPLRNGPRNDRIQVLYDRYIRACREIGLAARPDILQALANLAERDIHPGLSRIALVVATNGQAVASCFLDTEEFRPLERWWVNAAPERDTERMRLKLRDAGALAYQRAVKDGSNY